MLVAATLLGARVSYAQPQPQPEEQPQAQPKPAEPDDIDNGPIPYPEPEVERPTSAAWAARYQEARAKLIAGEFADAAVRFAELESTATNKLDRSLAHAQRTLADEWTAKNLTFVRHQDLNNPSVARKAPDKRSTDELVSLYTNAVVYGLGTGVWLAVVIQPQTAAAGILPAIAFTAGSVGTVMALDQGRGFRYGVPQSIVSGMWIGFENGSAWTIWYNSKGSDMDDEAAASLVWGFSTAGALLGGAAGSLLRTTPGRSAWVGSTAFWTGAVAGLTTGALVSNRPEAPAFAVTGVGLNAGTAVGIASAGPFSPSIARVRLIDLSGLLGGLTASGLYVAAANDRANGRATAGMGALGVVGGLVVGFLATSSMPPDRLREPTPDEPASSASGASATRTAKAEDPFFARAQPMMMPLPALPATPDLPYVGHAPGSGAMIGLVGSLD